MDEKQNGIQTKQDIFLLFSKWKKWSRQNLPVENNSLSF